MAVRSASLALVDAAKRGDDSAFCLLLEPVLEQGYRLACGMLHEQQAAQDAVQEAALKAWRKLGQLREGSEMRPWFLGIVANECRMARRSRWWSVVESPQWLHSTNDSEDSVLIGMDVRRALRGLDHKKRLVIVLRWYLDLSLEEISAVTHSSVHAVEGRLQRGIHELKHRLEEERC